MMHKISIWKVYLLSFIGFALLGYAGFTILTPAVDTSVKLYPYWKECCSVMLSFLISSMYTLTEMLMRSSQKFWIAATELEEKANATENRAGLEKIYKFDLPALEKKAGAAVHYNAINKISTIVLTKLQYVK